MAQTQWLKPEQSAEIEFVEAHSRQEDFDTHPFGSYCAVPIRSSQGCFSNRDKREGSQITHLVICTKETATCAKMICSWAGIRRKT
jgi:hypothetical protein